MSEEYRFTTDWFTRHIPVWKPLLATVKPRKILEIGSFEGRSTCYMIEEASKYSDNLEIHCIDTWDGGDDPYWAKNPIDFGSVESRFWQNIKLAKQKVPDKKVDVIAHKGTSLTQVSKLICEGHLDSFDLVLVDGSHLAADVLYDAIVAYRLTRPNGIIVFDDYNVQGSADKLDHPKVAIDSFGYIYRNYVKVVPMNVDGKPLGKDDLYQLYLIKTPE